MAWDQSNFNPFLRRDLVQGSLTEHKGLYESDLGPSKSLNPGSVNDLIPGGILSMEKILAGIIIANEGTIGGWTIADDTLSSGNITIDSTNRRILISDGTNNRVLIGYQASGF